MAGQLSQARDDARQRAMNFYVWESRDTAEQFFSEGLRERVVELYGAEPEIEYFDVAQLVDNANPPL